jgi:hypothetical protein
MVPVGTTFSFMLNEPATVTYAFTQSAVGRKVKGKCVAAKPKNRRKQSCTRTITVGTLAHADHAGLNKLAFQGRLSPSKRLKPGRYTVVITAAAAGRTSTPVKLSFTIVK